MTVVIDGTTGIDTGTGSLIAANASTPTYVRLFEDTDNGSNYVDLIAPTSVASNRTLTLPDGTGTVALTSNVIGVGQTWQDVQSSRSLGVTYTNTTGKPIMVFATFAEISQYVICYVVVNGLTIAFGRSVFSGTNSYISTSFIVPDGNTYSFSGPDSVLDWIELR